MYKVDIEPHMWNGVITKNWKLYCRQVFHHANSTCIKVSNQASKYQNLVMKAEKSTEDKKQNYTKIENFSQNMHKTVYDFPIPTPKSHNVHIGNWGVTTNYKTQYPQMASWWHIYKTKKPNKRRMRCINNQTKKKTEDLQLLTRHTYSYTNSTTTELQTKNT